MLFIEYRNALRCVYLQWRVTFESQIFIECYTKIITQDPFQYILNTINTLCFWNEVMGMPTYPWDAQKKNIHVFMHPTEISNNEFQEHQFSGPCVWCWETYEYSDHNRLLATVTTHLKTARENLVIWLRNNWTQSYWHFHYSTFTVFQSVVKHTIKQILPKITIKAR